MRDEDLPALRVTRDSCRQDDVAPEQVAAFHDRLAGVEADAHAHALLGMRPAVAVDLLLDRDRAHEGAACARKGEHEAVALRLDLVAPVLAQRLADDVVVGAQHVANRHRIATNRAVTRPGDCCFRTHASERQSWRET